RRSADECGLGRQPRAELTGLAMTFDGKAFGREMVGIVKGYVARRLAPLDERLADLEARIAEIDGKAAPKPRVRVPALKRGDEE
ncbi:hypothetical protein, partial [Prosthecomicrobium pneumaticum]